MIEHTIVLVPQCTPVYALVEVVEILAKVDGRLSTTYTRRGVWAAGGQPCTISR